jgi:hypothetical protein
MQLLTNKHGNEDLLVIYVQATFQMPSSKGSLIIAIKLS